MIKTASELIAEAQKQISCLDVSSAKALYDDSKNVVIIDVREADSAAKLKLQDSINIPRGLIEMQVLKHCPQENALIMIHCAGGGRASLAALTLTQMGYTNVHAITARFQDIKDSFG